MEESVAVWYLGNFIFLGQFPLIWMALSVSLCLSLSLSLAHQITLIRKLKNLLSFSFYSKSNKFMLKFPTSIMCFMFLFFENISGPNCSSTFMSPVGGLQIVLNIKLQATFVRNFYGQLLNSFWFNTQVFS